MVLNSPISLPIKRLQALECIARIFFLHDGIGCDTFHKMPRL
jgi:hypothetical protein